VGNVYVTGFFSATADFDPGPGTFNLTSDGGQDIFVCKLNSDGNFVWAKDLGGNGQDNGNSIAVDSAGNVLTTGFFTGTADFDPGPGTFNLTSSGSFDTFVSKLDSSGNFVWARDLGGNGQPGSGLGSFGDGIALDKAGNVYTTGFFTLTADFDPGPGTFNLTSAGDQDIFVSKLDSGGNFVWAKGFGGTGRDDGLGITLDGAGNVYTTGSFQNTADFDPGPGTFDLTSAGSDDVFVSKLDNSGNFVWAKDLGGSDADSGSGIATFGPGNVYTTGEFQGTADFDPGPGTFNLTSAGMQDVFLSKLVTPASSITGRASQTGQIWTGVTTGSSFTSSLWTIWSTGTTWVDVVTGDFNGDGETDIAGRDLSTGNWWVAVSNGASFANALWTNWNPNVTWADVQVGDFLGNGMADIVGRVQQTGQLWVAQSTGSSFTNSLWATWNPMATWVDIKVGDFDGDGKADIAGRYLQGGTWWTSISTGSNFTTSEWGAWNPNVTWVDINVGDFNGDGKADITGRVSDVGTWWTAISTGSSFTTSLWGMWNPGATWADVKVGDFNGDGKDDIIGRVLQSGQWWVSISSGSSFGNSLWSTWSTGVTWVDVQVGDFNGDGKSDVTARALETGQWWTGLSNGTSFNSSLWATWNPAASWVNVRSGDFA
jgi:hypothetical protein